MLNRFRAWREKGWQVSDARTYARAWQQWGGSVITHPEIVAGLSVLSGTEPRYLAWLQGDEPVGALATWGRFLALSRLALRHYRKKEVFDLGNAEVILPFAHEARIPLADAVIMVCNAPKSNTAYMAINRAMADVEKGNVGSIPRHLQNKHFDGEDQEVKGQFYIYTQDCPNHWTEQQYLPDTLKDVRYYEFGDNKNEQAFRQYWENIKGKKL